MTKIVLTTSWQVFRPFFSSRVHTTGSEEHHRKSIHLVSTRGRVAESNEVKSVFPAVAVWPASHWSPTVSWPGRRLWPVRTFPLPASAMKKQMVHVTRDVTELGSRGKRLSARLTVAKVFASNAFHFLGDSQVNRCLGALFDRLEMRNGNDKDRLLPSTLLFSVPAVFVHRHLYRWITSFFMWSVVKNIDQVDCLLVMGNSTFQLDSQENRKLIITNVGSPAATFISFSDNLQISRALSKIRSQFRSTSLGCPQGLPLSCSTV